jgi:hypothetical protein
MRISGESCTATSSRRPGIAQIYARLGGPERAIDWLERKERVGMPVFYAGIDPIFAQCVRSPASVRYSSGSAYQSCPSSSFVLCC